MKKYKNYKASGIEWLGEIPEHWDKVKLRYLADVTTGDKDTENREDDAEYPFFVRSQTVERISTYTFDGEAILTAGDGVGVCKVWHYINGKFDFHQRVYMLSNFKDIDGKYLFLFLKENFIHEVLKLSAKSTVDSLRRSMFLDFPVSLPPLSEQTSIASYLVHKTAQIDTLIEKKEQLIEKLKQQRQAIINEAVTGKCLNYDENDDYEYYDEKNKNQSPSCNQKNHSSRPMKDSGIEWLGEIPEHWEVMKLKYLGDCQNGVSQGSEYFGEGHPFVSYSDVYKNESLPFLVEGLANSTEVEQKRFSVIEGDIFFIRTSETNEEIGLSSICRKTIDKAVFAGLLIRFRPKRGVLHSSFSKFYFRCFIPRLFFVKEMNQVTRSSLSQELLKRLPIVLPSYNDQAKIGEYLECKTQIIDEIILKNQQSIKKLKLYRQSIISEAVTGKIDVRIGISKK